MRLMELGEKEVVNLNNGERLGLIADSDLIIDEKTGEISSFLVPERRFSFKILGLENVGKEIPWSAIRKIGYDMVIIELEPWLKNWPKNTFIINW